MMKPNHGDMILIPKGRHFYGSSWKVGDAPPRFQQDTLGVFIEVVESSHDDRVFWRIFTEMGPGIINSKFCEAVR
jgi:hypothetical protein